MSPNQKLKQLGETLEGCKRIIILTHDYPDPDCIASAIVLSYILKNFFGIKSRIVFGGHVLRAENKAMIKYLHIKLIHVSRIHWGKKNYVALVDTQKEFTNHSLPKSVLPLIVFDHHSPVKNDSAKFSDIRENYGATVTILYEYLKETNLEITQTLATAILFAISSETQDLGREASNEDIETYTSVCAIANKKILSRIIHPKLSHEFFTVFNSALQNVRQYRNIIHVHLGAINSPEFVSQIADLFLQHERITWSIVTGRLNNQLNVSLRSTNLNTNVGKLLQVVIGRRGFAGGHRMIAGGRINLENPDEEAWQKIEKLVIRRFLKKLRYEENVTWKPLLNH
jgi:nanoRNase/pAp phosphatase (c-di-AMP/oligoRNAs hydrolase)